MANTLIVLSVLLWIWLPYTYYKKVQFASSSSIAVGQIVAYEGQSAVRFVDAAGNEITTTFDGWGPADLEIGQRIEIVYSLEDPKQSFYDHISGLVNG